MADAIDSKSVVSNDVRVRSPPLVPCIIKDLRQKDAGPFFMCVNVQGCIQAGQWGEAVDEQACVVDDNGDLRGVARH